MLFKVQSSMEFLRNHGVMPLILAYFLPKMT